MMQSFELARKDFRHLLPEIAAYVALLVLYAATEPLTWQATQASGNSAAWANAVLSLIRPLIPFVWLLLIARSVQEDSLVGEQQFWITRPYKRSSLFAAKLIFIGFGVALPFATMQLYLVAQAHLHVTSAISGLLFNLFYLAVLCWLPFMAVAAVTASFVRALLAIVVLLLGFVLYTVAFTLRVVLVRPSIPHLEEVFLGFGAVSLFAIALLQYSTRRSNAARIALATTAVTLALLRIVLPVSKLIDHAYADVAIDDVLHFWILQTEEMKPFLRFQDTLALNN